MIRPWPPIDEWRIHIGAHKTATTHLQDTLALVRQRLNEQGVDFVPRGEFRAVARRLMSRRSPPYLFGGSLFALDLARRIRRIRMGGPRVVLSEENLLGSASGPLSPNLYIGMERRIPVLNALGKRASLTLFLSIRSFDRVLSGAYVTALRFQPGYVDILSRVRERVEAAPPSWVPLIDRIVASAPDARLRIWRQEDYGREPAFILNSFLGTTGMTFPNLPPPENTRTPCQEAVAALEAEARDANPKMSPEHWEPRSRAVLANFSHHERGERFRPFSDHSVALMRERYAEDCDEIRKRYGDALITLPA